MTVAELKADQRKHWEEVDADIDTQCTCNGCYPRSDDIIHCREAFDIYNFDGDCLACK